MLDLTHPIVEDVWNFFPFMYVFPHIVAIIGNLVLFVPNFAIRPAWVAWNGVTIVPHVILLIFTAFLWW